MYSLGKYSYGFIAKLFGVRMNTIQNWLEQESDLLKDPAIEDNISEIEFDEMWHFIGSKKKKCWIIKAYDRRVGKLSSRLQEVVTLLLSEDFIKRYNT